MARQARCWLQDMQAGLDRAAAAHSEPLTSSWLAQHHIRAIW